MSNKNVIALEAMSNKLNVISTVSHEIKTPMNDVIAMTSILKETDLNDEQKEVLDVIYESGSNLLKMINDVLDMSKLDVDKL